MVTCGTSGNARPIPSASTTGSPIRAAQVMGSRPFPPPISMAISAATWRPVMNSRLLPEPYSLVPVLELFQDDRGGADPGARHDQRVIGQFVQIDQGHRPEVLGCLQRLQQCHVGIAPATCAEDGAAPGQGTQ